MRDFDYKHDQIAAVVSKSRSHITNILRMLKLPESIQKLVRSGELSAGHAKILVGNENAVEIAKTIIAQGWSVRDLEAALEDTTQKDKNNHKTTFSAYAAAIPEIKELERIISSAIGLNVKLVEKPKGKGSHIKIYYSNEDQFTHLMERLEIRS
jgi:ParB family chromosome partitioning protein